MFKIHGLNVNENGNTFSLGAFIGTALSSLHTAPQKKSIYFPKLPPPPRPQSLAGRDPRPASGPRSLFLPSSPLLYFPCCSPTTRSPSLSAVRRGREGEEGGSGEKIEKWGGRKKEGEGEEAAVSTWPGIPPCWRLGG